MVLQTMETPPFDLQAYEPPISLWSLVEQNTPRHEREEIRNMLGESLVDQSLELHEEISTLLEIWRDYREETTHCDPVPTLAEPPGVRDRLVQEIQFFVNSVKEKAKHEGVNADKFLSRHKSDVLEYALDTYRSDSVRSPSRPGTARGGDGRETPMITSPVGSDRMSAASTLSEEVESMNDKLTVLKFDEVVSHLRTTLEEEIETLMKDIYFLQNCLDDEATFRAESVGTLKREPTLSDLRQERSSLEKDLLSNMKTQTSPTLKPNFNNPVNLKPLGPAVSHSGKVKTSPITITNTHTPKVTMKPGPMKAFTSPDSHSSGATSSSPTRLTSPGHPPSGAPTSSNTITRRKMAVGTVHKQTFEHHNLPARGDGLDRTQQDSSDHRVASGRRLTKVPKSPDTDLSANSNRPSQRKSSLEAVVTLSKDGESGVSEIHMVPSPPSSAKPSSTPARPGSAQRFRKMVLDCRD